MERYTPRNEIREGGKSVILHLKVVELAMVKLRFYRR
jgi:hypothetical protein